MPKKIQYKAPRRGPLTDSIVALEKTIVEWDWQAEIKPLLEQIIVLKKQENVAITGNPNYDSYPGLCGYLQALVGILGAKSPRDVVQWLETEKTKLETDLPFVILKHSGNK